MQKKSLTEIFELDPDSSNESIFNQDGLVDYIEDIVWQEEPLKCSEENRANIEKVLDAHISQRDRLNSMIDFEKTNGKGSYRNFLNKGIKLSPLVKKLTDLEEHAP